MPKLKEKPPKITLPTCGGCDNCGDFDESALYLLGYKGLYYCKECFFKLAPNWKIQNSYELSDEDIKFARECGLRRSKAGRKRKGIHKYNWKPGDEQPEVDAQSAVTEYLVAKYLNREWLSSGEVPDDPKNGDVEGGIQVRHTDRENGCLIVHPEDRDDQWFVLVTGKDSKLKIAGGKLGSDAKQAKFWRTEGVRYPAYFVPQHALENIDHLRRKNV